MPAASRMGSTTSQLLLVFELREPIEALLWHGGSNGRSSLFEDLTLVMAHAGESPDEAIGRFLGGRASGTSVTSGRVP